MKRIWIGIGLLVFLVIVGFLIMHITDSRLGDLSRQLQQAALEPDGERAAELARKSQELWKRSWHFSAALSDHTNLSRIDAAFAQLEIYQERGDMISHAAICAQLSEEIQDLAENHRLTWWNLL